MSYEFRIGFRYLLSRKHNALLSIITVISIVGVVLGVTALTVVLSVVSGFEEDFQRKILGNNAPLILFRHAGPLRKYKELVPKIEAVKGVKAASPFLYSEVLLHSAGGRSAGVVIYGVDPAKIGNVTSLQDDLVSGKLTDLRSTERGLPGIAVGWALANNQLYLFQGGTVDVVSPSGEITPFGFGPKVRRFEVAGIFRSGMHEYDSKSAYIGLTEAQRFFGRRGEASGIQISVNNIDRAHEVAERVGNVVGDHYYVRHWMELDEFTLRPNSFKLIASMNHDKVSIFQLRFCVFRMSIGYSL